MNRDEFSEFFSLLVSDCSRAAQLWHENDDGYTKRSYIRAVFAFIEGNSFRMKQICVFGHNNGYNELSVNEIYKALEIKNDKKIKISTTDNIKLSFALFSKMYNVKNTLDTSGEDWENLKKALNIRHRLTHPKAVKDFELSTNDMVVINNAAEFYRVSTCKLIGA